MFKKLIKNKKAQQTAEYALLISLVVAAVIAMQTYTQRTIQARVRDAGGYLVTETSALGQNKQYEPYYLATSYDINRDDTTVRAQINGNVDTDQYTRTGRQAGGYQISNYLEANNLAY